MTKRDFIKELESHGFLKLAYQFGLISFTPLLHAEIFDYWLTLLPDKNYSEAVFETSEKFKVSQPTVWRVIYSMKEKKEVHLPKIA